MKFAKTFEDELSEGNIPSEWRSAAIQYKALKKCIKKVVRELAQLGLTSENLSLVFEHGGLQQGHASSPDGLVEPKIILRLHEDIPIDADISPASKNLIQDLISDLESIMTTSTLTEKATPLQSTRSGSISSSPSVQEVVDVLSTNGNSGHRPPLPPIHTDDLQSPLLPTEYGDSYTIAISLRSDSEFFQMLSEELANLDELQAREKLKLTQSIRELGKQVMTISKPSERKKDMYSWRDFFRVYIDAGVFFSVTERNRGTRTAQDAQARLKWFATEVDKQGITKRLNKNHNAELLRDFWAINASLVQNLRFQEMNKEALNKILKKFDKQTSLNATSTFPETVQGPFYAGSLGQEIVQVMSQDLIAVIPQLDEYICPVCSSITVKPVRLECSHVFCVRCLVVLQRENNSKCPLCRSAVVMKADSGKTTLRLFGFDS